MDAHNIANGRGHGDALGVMREVARRAGARLAVARHVAAVLAASPPSVEADDLQRARCDGARRLNQHEVDAGLLDVDRVMVEPFLGLHPAVTLGVVKGFVSRLATALETVDGCAQGLLCIAKGSHWMSLTEDYY